MPLISSLSAGARAFGLYVLAALATVIDTFNRSDNATDLGSISGQKWKIWRGVWGISGNKAVSSTTASTYPLATLTFTKTDVTVSISGQDPGMGAAFWVTDAENWYATTYVQVESCQTCNNCNSWNASNCNQFSGGNPATYTCVSWICNAYTCNAWTCNSAFCNSFTCVAWSCNSFICASRNPSTCSGGFNNSTCNSWNPSNCKSWTLGNCIAWNNVAPKGYCASRNPSTCSGGFNTSTCNSWNASNCKSWTLGNCIAWSCLSPVCNKESCNAYTCNAWSCSTSTCNSSFCSGGTTATWNPIFCSGFYNNPNCNAFFAYTCNCVTEHKINILSFIAGSISTLATYLYNSAIQSFKSIKSGNSVTVSAYSDTSWGTQIGSSNNYSITTPVKTRQHGIIKSPSSFGQGNSINEIRVD